MQHVWLSRQPQQDKMLRLWDSQKKTWQWLGDWQALRAHTNDKDLCLYVPTQSVLSMTSELTTSQLKQLGATGQQYLFEDMSLTPVEQLQVKSLHQADQHYLYAMAGAQIDQWQQSAGLADFVVQVILPDFLLLPIPDARLGSQVVIYYDEDTTLLRTSAAAGMGISYIPSLAAELASMSALDEITLFTTAPNLPQLQVLNDLNYSSLQTSATGESDSTLDERGIEAGSVDNGIDNIGTSVAEAKDANNQGTNNQDIKNTDIERDKVADIVAILQRTGALVNVSSEPLLPVTHPERHALNMVKKDRQSKLSPYLKTTLAVALAALVLQIGADALQWYQYQQAELVTKQATAEQYAYWFNDEQLNPRTTLMAQVEPRLISTQSADMSQLGVLNRVAPLLQQSNMVAQSLTWDDTAIHLTVFSEHREGLDQLVSGLTQQGISANLGSVVPQPDGGLVGELTLPLSSSASSSEQASVSSS